MSETFWLHGDQQRDWTWALAPLAQLRLAGVPSHVGGSTLGPVWYWFLWTARHAVGPWTGNLPHAGAFALAAVQAAADVTLLLGLRRFIGSWWMPLAAVLLLASQPTEIEFTAAMWNPALSAALVKITLGLVFLAAPAFRAEWVAAITVCGWLAVQAHSIAICVTGPLLAALVAAEAAQRRLRQAAARARLIVEFVALLQVPMIVNLVRHPDEPAAPSALIDGIRSAARHPGSLHALTILRTILSTAGAFLLTPLSGAGAFSLAVLIVAAAAVAARRNVVAASVTVLPFAAFWAFFVATQTPWDSYYLTPLMPAMAASLALAATLTSSALKPLGALALVLCVVAQPSRLSDGWTGLRMPEYGPLARGSREIRRRMDDVQNIETDFEMPPFTDTAFLYTTLGGRIIPESRYTARIARDGSVTFTLVAP